MRTLYQDDLFGGPPVVTKVQELPARRRRALAETTLDAGKKKGASATDRERERVLAEIKSNGAAGRTHHEISERLGIPLQSMCWRVKPLLDAKLVFYAETGWNPERAKPIYLQREGRKVLVAAMYANVYPRPWSISEELERSA